MQQYHFHRDQFSEDVTYVKATFWKFVTSFGPSEKKIVDRPIGFIESSHIRFRLALVEMGISKVIRTVILLIVGILVYFIIFRHADPFFKLIIAIAFFSYYVWLFVPHLVKDGKFEFKDGIISGTPEDKSSEYLIMFYNKRVEAQKSIGEKIKEMWTRKKAE